MIEFKMGDLLITRGETEFFYIERFKKAYSEEEGTIDINDYIEYKSNIHNQLDIIKHKRDGKVLYKEFEYNRPTEITPIDTKVLVWTYGTFKQAKESGLLIKRYFKKIDIFPNDVIVFTNGKTSFTSIEDNFEFWDNAVIYEDGMLD